jgi:hypothetical protein
MKLIITRLVIIALLGMMISQTDSAVQPIDVVIRHNESTNGSILANNSSLQAQEQSKFSQAPKIMVIGKGYYAAHPINYSSQFGKQTWLKNRATGASMNHEVGSAHNLSQTLEMSTQDSRRKSESGISGYSGIQMKVSENVQEGKVSIGVLQGGTSGIGTTPSSSALRNPSLDIEEDYIGTFHIQKNISIEEPFGQAWQNYSWLPCCAGGYFDSPYFGREFLSTENIFDYKTRNSIFSV